MHTPIYGAVLSTDKFGKVGFKFDSRGRLLELSWRKGFAAEVNALAKLKAPCPSLAQLRKYLDDYTRGCGPQFPGEFAFPLAAQFSSKVYAVVSAIKVGQALSYQQVAELAGSPKAYRAVGNIMGKNPIPLVIP